MRRITKINIEKSISEQRLIFQEDWLDKFDRVGVFIFFGGFLIYPLLLIIEADFNNSNDKFVSLTIMPLLMLFGLYVIYRKANEKRLFKIITPFDKLKNKQVLLKYAEAQNLEIYRNSNDCIILNETLSNINPSYKKSMVFIVKDNQVLFTILKDQFRLNVPTLITHLFIRSDLRKLFGSELT